jgi:plasmid stability protein
MATVTIRNLPDEVHRALRVQAARHGRSTEAEIRIVLETAVIPDKRIRLGTLLTEIGRQAGGVDLSVERDPSPAEPVQFE